MPNLCLSIFLSCAALVIDDKDEAMLVHVLH